VLRDLGLGKPGPDDAQLFEAAAFQVYPETEYGHQGEDRADSCKDGAIFQDGISGSQVEDGKGNNFLLPCRYNK
jgi:hypothetical protein